MQKLLSFFVLICLLAISPLQAQKDMDNKRMGKIFSEVVDRVEGETGAWQLLFKERILLVLTDEPNNRMRIFTPIVEEEEIDASEMRNMLRANFHSALDAKYSLYNGLVISTFTHPLKELTEDQLLDALSQVVNLANTFGTSYSSTELIFGAPKEKEKDKRLNESPSKSKKS